jgi:exodeoxyribonuclease VIII
MKSFIGCFIPKKAPADKLNLQTLSVLKSAPNKKAAGAIITGAFFQEYPEIAEHYFDGKIIEDSTGNDRPALDEWSTDFVWKKETGNIEFIPANPEVETPHTAITGEPEFIEISKCSTNPRAALLVLFGRTENITKAEYSLAIDLTNDDETSPEREMYEAITRLPRVLALFPDRQVALLADAREKVKAAAKWPDYLKFMEKWLNSPPEKRDTPAEVKPATVPEYVSLTFEQKIAVAINAPTVELDEVTPEILSDATNQRKCEYPAFIRAHKALTYIQPTLENFSDRLLGNAIRSVDFNEDKGIVSYRRAILDYLGVYGDAEEESVHNTSVAADVLVTDSSEDGKLAENAAGAGEPTQEVGPEDTRTLMSDREIEISHAINALLSGCTDVMGKEEAEGVVTCTGHLIPEVFPSLIADIAATEFCLSPDFSDEEIYNVATSVLDAWTDNEAKRQIVALNAITEWRTTLPAPADIESPVISPDSEQIHAQAVHATTSAGLTYRQQLTIAAIQGLCANPACFGVFDEIAEMAITLANATDRESD